MHEYSVAVDIAELVMEHSRGKKLERIHLSVGALSGVFFDSLQMYLQLVLEEKGFDGVRITFRPVPASFLCDCGREYEAMKMTDGCPACGGYERKIIGGKDCKVESIEVNDD